MLKILIDASNIMFICVYGAHVHMVNKSSKNKVFYKMGS